MFKKDSNIKTRQNNLINIHKVKRTQLNFNKNQINNSFKTMNLVETQYNYNNKPPHLLHDTRSSSSINFYPSNYKVKNSLAFFPINLKVPKLNNSNKNIDNKVMNNRHNKSPIDIIKIPKTNLNSNVKNKITFNMIKMNKNKNKENKNINYIMSAFNLTSKNINSGGIFKKKIFNKNNGGGLNNLSNSMTYINNNTKVSGLNSNSNIIGNNTNGDNNKNKNRLEDAKKEKERLNILFNEKVKDSKTINEKIKELENKNKLLTKKINKIKKENDNYASTLDKIIKLKKLLKNNGFDVAEILNNLSLYDNEESNEEEKKEEQKEENLQSKSITEEFSFKIDDESKKTKFINIKENSKKKVKENFKHNKNNKNEDNFAQINFKRKTNINNEQNNQNEEFSFNNNKNKNIDSIGE